MIVWTAAAVDPVIQAIDRLCHLVGLNGETLDSLEGTVSEIALTYTRHRPAELQPQLQQLLVYVEQLLEAYPQSKHRLRLQAVSGWLSGLAARAFDDLGDLPAAAANARTALALGRFVGDHKLAAWACNLHGGVWFRLENPGQALRWAREGVAVAPPRTAQRIRLLGWQAIVQARLGQTEAVLATLDTAQREFDRLLATEFADGLLGIGPMHMPSCISTATRWLDLPGTTLRNAELVIDAEQRQPKSPARLALARLDLAAALAQLGRADEAIGHAAAALGTERLTSTIVQRAEHLDGLLTQRWPDEAIVREFHEQRLAMSPPAPSPPTQS